jgi:hypothetical protein
MPKNGNSESAMQTLRLAVKIAHHGAHMIAESHQDHREMLASIAKWVPHQYVLSALKMDLEQKSATSAFAQTAIDRARQRGARRLLLGAYGENHRAIAFYRRTGFVQVGTRIFHVGQNDYDDVVLALEL